MRFLCTIDLVMLKVESETTKIEVGGDRVVVAPTEPEALRVKGYLVVQRNVVRDYLDVAALSAHLGCDAAAGILAGIDDYYADRSDVSGSVATSLALALADPSPRDTTVLAELHRYKNLDERWYDWNEVVGVCQDLALMISGAS